MTVSGGGVGAFSVTVSVLVLSTISAGPASGIVLCDWLVQADGISLEDALFCWPDEANYIRQHRERQKLLILTKVEL